LATAARQVGRIWHCAAGLWIIRLVAIGRRSTQPLPSYLGSLIY